MAQRTADVLQRFLRSGKIGQSGAYIPPTFATIGVDEQSGVERNARRLIQNPIALYHLGTRVAQNCKLLFEDLFPKRPRIFTIVDTDTNYSSFQCLKILAVLRELTQLPGAIGSPVSAVEHQQHTLPAQ
jgi:hypothetical protein